MIVTEEQAKQALDNESANVVQKHDPDGPPAYEPPAVEVRYASASSPPIHLPPTSTEPPVPADVYPTNHLVVSQTNNAIKGRYVIDPSIVIPAALLPELDDSESSKKGKKSKDKEEERLGHGEHPNLRLTNTNGSIAADVWLVGDLSAERREGDEGVGKGGEGGKKRAFIDAKNTNGSIKLQVTSNTHLTPFALSARTTNGSIQLFLPRSFQGPLTIRKGNGSVRLSPSIEARMQMFSDVRGTRSCFVGGDFRAVGYEGPGAGWKGCAVDVGSSNGSISVSYVDDEARGEDVRSVLYTFSGPGFWSRLFGTSTSTSAPASAKK